jgi:hypothetical protein
MVKEELARVLAAKVITIDIRTGEFTDEERAVNGNCRTALSLL